MEFEALLDLNVRVHCVDGLGGLYSQLSRPRVSGNHILSMNDTVDQDRQLWNSIAFTLGDSWVEGLQERRGIGAVGQDRLKRHAA